MNRWFDALDGFATGWSAAMLNACWRGGIALALAWAICLFTPQLPARVRCWMWRLAYLELILALVWTTPLDLPLLPPRTTAVRTAALQSDVVVVTPGSEVRRRPESAAEEITSSEHLRSRRRESPENLSTFSSLPARINLREILLAGWLGWLVVYAMQLLLAWRKVSRWRRDGRSVSDPSLRACCEQLSHDLGVQSAPRVFSSDRDEGPLLLGLWRPVIILPETLLQSCPPDEIRMLLAHELAHVRRRDLLWNWLPAVAVGLFPFHPLVWLVRRQWKVAQESACDESAVAVTGAAPAEYGDILLRVVARQPMRGALFPHVLAVGAGESRWILKRRLTQMKHFQTLQHWTRRRLVSLAVCLSLVGVMTLVPWRVVAQQAPAKIAGDTKETAATSAQTAVGSNTTAPGSPHSDSTAPGWVGPFYLGSIVAATAEIRAPGGPGAAGGRIKTINFREGQAVHQSDVLVEFDDEKQMTALNNAEVQLEVSLNKLQLKERIQKQGVATEAEVDEANLEVKLAKTALEASRREVSELEIRAPFDGVVDACDLRAGETVPAGSLITRVIELGALKTQFYVPQDALATLQPGAKIKVRSNALRDRAFTGEVYFISPQLDPATGTAMVKAKLTGDTGSLRAGMVAVVTVERN